VAWRGACYNRMHKSSERILRRQNAGEKSPAFFSFAKIKAIGFVVKIFYKNVASATYD
jgi:hypothetical protein